MDGAPGARAVALKDTLPGALGCRCGRCERCSKKFRSMLSIRPRAVRRDYMEDENALASRGALLALFILVP
jgi:hypothetical protein